MYLVEKHIINNNHSFYNECDTLCFQTKNVYNQALYNVRQHYFETKQYLNYYSNYSVTKEQECYAYLPTKVFCQTLRMVDKNFKSFSLSSKTNLLRIKFQNILINSMGDLLLYFLNKH